MFIVRSHMYRSMVLPLLPLLAAQELGETGLPYISSRRRLS
jgi:hypothetical protein